MAKMNKVREILENPFLRENIATMLRAQIEVVREDLEEFDLDEDDVEEIEEFITALKTMESK